MNTIYLNTDGGSRGNPGPAAIGVVFFDGDSKELHTYKECIGDGTNNEAEYRAIIKALEILTKSRWFVEHNSADNKVICRLDSQLVVEQINGNYKVKQEHIKVFMVQIKEYVSEMKLQIEFIHIRREENKIADRLVNEALDEQVEKNKLNTGL
jgi:ribonuclease HI